MYLVSKRSWSSSGMFQKVSSLVCVFMYLLFMTGMIMLVGDLFTLRMDFVVLMGMDMFVTVFMGMDGAIRMSMLMGMDMDVLMVMRFVSHF